MQCGSRDSARTIRSRRHRCGYSAAVASPWTEFRFVEGRPVGDVTVQFLATACDQLRAEEKTRLIVVWDVASWHAGRPVSD